MNELRECHVVDERDMRQVDTRLGRCATIAADRDVAHRLERFVGERMLLTRDRIEFRVAGKAGFERAVEIRAPDALELVVELDRDAARFDDRAELAADIMRLVLTLPSRGPRPAPGSACGSGLRGVPSTTKRLRNHSALPSRNRRPCAMPEPANQWWRTSRTRSGSSTGLGPMRRKRPVSSSGCGRSLPARTP